MNDVPSKVRAVFERWKERLGHPRAKLDERRYSKIRKRLLDGYTVEDLFDAIEGCALSDFHQGANERHQVYDDIELICRDATHVDRFLRIKQQVDQRKAREEAARKRMEELEQMSTAQGVARMEEWRGRGGNRGT